MVLYFLNLLNYSVNTAQVTAFTIVVQTVTDNEIIGNIKTAVREYQDLPAKLPGFTSKAAMRMSLAVFPQVWPTDSS